jgi:TPP-dependent pyruvate/acetoin dehydrogenase alpha subunit
LSSKSKSVSDIPLKKVTQLYKTMVLIRQFEDKAYELFSQNLIPGTIHLYAGQEAVAAGVCGALRDDDYIESTHRGHGHCIAKGADVRRMMAELMGKRDGYCKGKGGSMHIADFSTGNLGAEGVVGAGLPIAVGAGLSAKLRGTDQVVACFFGDGAANNGTFGESLNLAAVWKAPVIFVCENNLYAMSVPYFTAFAIENVADRAGGYGLPGVIVDGMDVLEVYRTVKESVNRARKGNGPTLIECKTYRWRGHSRLKSHESNLYSTDEYNKWKKKDPIERFKRKRILNKKELTAIDQEVEALIQEAVEFGQNSPYPNPEEAVEDVYA